MNRRTFLQSVIAVPLVAVGMPRAGELELPIIRSNSDERIFLTPEAVVRLSKAKGPSRSLVRVMEQLILHLVGDYVTQSHWMATTKTQSSVAAGAHALVYSLPFLLLKPSALGFAVILGTHFLIDRYRLARYVCWAKNWLAPRWISMATIKRPRLAAEGYLDNDGVEYYQVRNESWAACCQTGYPPDTAPWLAVWLLIWADNTLHIAINYAALRWL